MEQEIKMLFKELGVIVFQHEVQKSPSYTTIHYELFDITQLPEVAKKVKLISAFLHTEILIRKSNTSHFALAIPNKEKVGVNFYDEKYKYLFNKRLSKPQDIFAGITDENIPQVINLDEMPHILVAGTTGSGKSVMVNNIICSILRNSEKLDKEQRPDFYMIDTKRVELSPYKQIGEKCEVATSFERGVQILKEVCYQIDARYELMEKFGYRTMPNNLYRVIVVIEELSDLMLASKKAVEKHIVKIAQLGRACGVHLIIATQRPTVDVVTGQIKANIGCRFALKTTSSIDSRNILDKSGAEKLSGKGDCLLKLPETTDEIHLQCPYISDKDIEKTIKNYSGRN